MSFDLVYVYIRFTLNSGVNIGEFDSNEKIIRFEEEIICTNCKKKVPGGLQTGEKYYQTGEFVLKLEELKKNYLCGICRDKRRRAVEG